MSGGPIIEIINLALVGINGRSAYPILNTCYIYQDGTPPTPEELEKIRQISWGIPLNPLLLELSQDTLTAYNLPQPYVEPDVRTTTLVYRILFVVYVVRNQRTRIISARLATIKEKKQYEQA